MGKNDIHRLIPLHNSPLMDKMFRRFEANLYRTKILRPGFEDAYRKKSEDHALIHGIKKKDDGEGK
jgi:hypothetical protein